MILPNGEFTETRVMTEPGDQRLESFASFVVVDEGARLVQVRRGTEQHPTERPWKGRMIRRAAPAPPDDQLMAGPSDGDVEET